MVNLYKALAGFQSEVPVLHKDTSGYGYSYTDLPEIVRVITPILNKHGLAYTQLLNGNELKTIVFHVESGENIESVTPIPEESLKGMNKFQILGSAITYIRRYSLSAMLGLVTDKDMDASTLEDKIQRATTENELGNIFKSLSKDQQANSQVLFTKRKNEIINNKNQNGSTSNN